jgi:hypothetical protein
MGETMMDRKELVALKPEPGVCVPWQEKLKELPEICGDEELLKKIWKDNDTLSYIYIWHCLLSF